MTTSYRGLLAPWIGGAANDPTATAVGYRGMLAPWAGGAGSVAPTSGGEGYTSLLAFWMGGGGYGPAIDAIAPDWIVLARRRGRR